MGGSGSLGALRCLTVTVRKFPHSGSHHSSRQGMVAPCCLTAMAWVGRAKGMVWRVATKTGARMTTESWGLFGSCCLPQSSSFLAVSKVGTNPDKYSPSLPRLQTPVFIALAPGIWWMEKFG